MKNIPNKGFNETLKRMLNTPPKQHKEEGESAQKKKKPKAPKKLKPAGK